MEKIQLNKTFIRFFFWALFGTFFSLAASLAGIYLYLSPNLPPIASLKDIELQTPLRVYSIDNKLIGEFGEKRRDPISIKQVPQILVNAILAAEDDAYYEHSGVSIKSLLRATTQLLLTGEIQSGGSTITMQVARNFFLSREQTFSRKFNEILLAIKIEQALGKSEILELYINKIYLGNRAYGFQAASQAYYGKDLGKLTTAQLAMIAGLPKAPSTYNPIANPSRALIRRNWILKRMLNLGKLSNEQYEQAITKAVTAKYHGQKLDFNAPYIAEAARERMVELFGESAYTHGYKIYTTIDSHLQHAAQTAVVNGLLAYDKRHGYRGPEKKLDHNLLEAPPQSEPKTTATQNDTRSSTTELPEGIDLTPWLNALKKIPLYGKLKPAVIVKVSKQSALALTPQNQIVEIAWENGLKDARRFVNENFATAPPKSASKVVQPGDVIRIYKDEQELWHFSQTPEIEAALVSISPNDGAIKSIVGGFDFNHSSFNRASQAKRQPGSNFKPFVYAAGLENGMSPATIFNDAPIVVEDNYLESTWRPENASGKFYGPTRLRKALYLSRNLVSIRLLRRMGIETAIQSLDRFGINTASLPKNLSMVLGSYVMSPLEVAIGYSTFANGGYKVDPYLIHHIRDRHDQVLFKAEPYVVDGKKPLIYTTAPPIDPETHEALKNITTDADTLQVANKVPLLAAEKEEIEEGAIKSEEVKSTREHQEQEPYITVELPSKPAEAVMDKRIAYIMTSMLKDAVKRGTATRAKRLGRDDIAGKTGTTNGPTDAWFSGYNGHLVTTTWVGFDNNKKLGRGEYGGVAALPIWIEFMKTALDGVPSTSQSQPDGIVTVRIDPETGERAAPSNPSAIFEIFTEETAPPERQTNTSSGGNYNSPLPEELF